MAGDECKSCGSFLIHVTSGHYIKPIHMFEDDVTPPEYALVIPGGLLGSLGWWSDVCRMFAFLGLSQYFE